MFCQKYLIFGFAEKSINLISLFVKSLLIRFWSNKQIILILAKTRYYFWFGSVFVMNSEFDQKSNYFNFGQNGPEKDKQNLVLVRKLSNLLPTPNSKNATKTGNF